MNTPIRFLITCLLLCAALPPAAHARSEYVPPADAPTANLRMVNTRPDGFFMRASVVDLQSCKVSDWLPWLGGGAKIDQVRVGIPASEPPRHGIAERKIQAGVPIAIAAPLVLPKLKWWEIFFSQNPTSSTHDKLVRNGHRHCPAPLFVPEAGADYEVVFNADLDTCEATLFRLAIAADGTVSRTDITGPVITFPNPRNANKAECSALAQLQQRDAGE
jgi:hypothetical protein